MSCLPPGNYYIVNKASLEKPGSDPLVINFNGVLTPLNVTRLEHLPTQVWVVTEWKDKRVLSPGVVPEHHVGMGKHFTDVWVIHPHPDPPSCWYIKGSEKDGYTIQNGSLTGYWSLKDSDVVHGGTISFGAASCGDGDKWVLREARPIPDILFR